MSQTLNASPHSLREAFYALSVAQDIPDAKLLDDVVRRYPEFGEELTEFAIALAGSPSVILLDEPTAGMSADERALVVEVLKELNERLGLSILFTEHDIDMVFALAQRIVVMHQGELIAEGTPQQVRADPRVREVYLGKGHRAEM